MKLLATSKDCSDIYQLSTFLRDNGIAACIVEHNAPIPGVHSGVWIILDGQYRDALMLYDNPSHKVSYPLSREEIIELEERSKEHSLDKLSRVIGLLFVGSIALLIILVSGIYGWFYLMDKI